MTWSIDGINEDAGRFQNLDPVEVLYELEAPKIFTAKCGGIVPVLVYESYVDVVASHVHLIVAPTSSAIILALKDGAKTVIQALDQPWVWAVTQDFDGASLQAVLLPNGIESVPDGYKPKKAAMLWPQLMPLVSVRLIGNGLREGHVPASVIKRAADSIPSALKKCFEEAFGAKTQGRPDDAVRNLYDLEAQQMAFNSFEISFRAAEPSQLSLSPGADIDSYLEQGAALRMAIGWALDDVDAFIPSVELVEALEKIVPPMHGIVEEIEVRGRIFNDSRIFRLGRTSTKKVKRFLTDHRAAVRTLFTTEGVIDELDKGQLTFTLRGTNDGKDLTFTFEDDFLDDVFMAFSSSVRVNVSGKQISLKKSIEMLGLDFLNPLVRDT